MISTGWVFAAIAGLFAAMACGGHEANINRAVTLATAIVTHNFSKLVPFICAQMLGAFVGSALVWLHFLPHRAGSEDPIHKLSCFCSHSAIPNKPANLLGEIIATTVLVFGGACIISRANIPAGLGARRCSDQVFSHMSTYRPPVTCASFPKTRSGLG